LPGVDLYRRAEERLGVTGMLCTPWTGLEPVSPGQHGRQEPAERYRPGINRFAERIVSRC
jgi:hypothetical protein